MTERMMMADPWSNRLGLGLRKLFGPVGWVLLAAGLAWASLGPVRPAEAEGGYVAVACLRRNADQCGVINEKGDWVISPGFDRIDDFASNGLAVAVKRNRPGIINIRGEWVIQPGFDRVEGEWSAGLIKVGRSDRRTGLRYGLADQAGRLAVEPSFRDIKPFGPNRLAGACEPEAGCGFINTEGAWAVPPIFEQVEPFSENGLAPARRLGQDLWGYINTAGDFVIPPVYAQAYPFDGDRAKVVSGGRFSLINSRGQAVGSHKFASLDDFEPGGLAPAQRETDGLFGLINRSGAWVVQPRFERIYSFNGGPLAPAQQDGLFGFINRSGRWVIKPAFGNVEDFEARGGRAPAEQSGTWGLIDSAGRWVVEPDHLLMLNSGGVQGPIQVFAENGRWGLMDENGRWLLEPILTATPCFAANGLSEAKVDGLYGFIDRFGNWVVEPSFQQVGMFRRVPEVPPAKARKFGRQSASSAAPDGTRFKVEGRTPGVTPPAEPAQPDSQTLRQARSAARDQKQAEEEAPARRSQRKESSQTRFVLPDKASPSSPAPEAEVAPKAAKSKSAPGVPVDTAPLAQGYIPPQESDHVAAYSSASGYTPPREPAPAPKPRLARPASEMATAAAPEIEPAAPPTESRLLSSAAGPELAD